MATERYRIRIAPGGLALVQELLNTRAIGQHADDLLASEAAGLDWLRATVRPWAEHADAAGPAGEPAAADLTSARDLRARLAEIIQSASVAPCRVPADLIVAPDGTVGLAPPAAGSWGEWLESAVWAEVLLAQRAGNWPRLKLCREPACASAFYDMSRNNSGVWHDVRVCGNAANLRASRLRKKQQAERDIVG